MGKPKHLKTSDELLIREQLDKMTKEEVIERHLYKMKRLGNVFGIFFIILFVGMCALTFLMSDNYNDLSEEKNSQIEVLAEHICMSNYDDQLQQVVISGNTMRVNCETNTIKLYYWRE